jgi:AAHS family 4-hydroxybenzoate transporter-like MFS transporter
VKFSPPDQQKNQPGHTTTNMQQTFQVNEFVDGQKLGRFNFLLLVWSFLTMFADGFDLNSLGFAAPDLTRMWGVERSAMGPVLSANLLGIFIGAPALGWLGDRYGRRPLIIAGTLLYGVMTLLMAFSTTMEQMMVLRFIAGIGIGGIMPNTISLNSELTPKKFRSALIVLMFMGITTGSTAVGLVAAYFMPTQGWQIIFQAGGVLPIVVGVGLIFALPESLKLLAIKPGRRDELIATARRMRPDLVIADDAIFQNPPIIQQSEGQITELFKGGLAFITPLLWVCFAIALMANFFLNNTLPLIYDNYGIPAQEAALTATMYHAGGILGGLVITVLLDRMGFSIVAILFALALPAIILLGMQNLGFTLLAGVAGIAGIAVLGAQFGNNAAAGLLYPTSIRGKGVGLALSIGRLGAIVGPTVGAALLGMELTMERLFLIAAVPIVLGLLAAMLLSWLCYRRFNSFLLDDTPVADRPASDK